MAEFRICCHDGVPQRIDDCRLYVVGQVPARLRRWHLAPAILDLLFLGERVVHPGKELDVCVEDPREFPRRSFAKIAVLVRQMVQGRFKVLFLAVHVERQPRDGFVKEPVPSGRAHRRLVVQELLQLVRELVRAHGTHPVEDGLVAS